MKYQAQVSFATKSKTYMAGNIYLENDFGGQDEINSYLAVGYIVEYSGGGGGGGSDDYTDLKNKPSVNNVSLVGNKTLEQLGINIPNKVSQLTNDKGYIDKSVDNLDNYTKTADMNTAFNSKVDKVNGKGLSTNDFTNDDKAKVNAIGNKDNLKTNSKEVVGGINENYDKNVSQQTQIDYLLNTGVKNVLKEDIALINSQVSNRTYNQDGSITISYNGITYIVYQDGQVQASGTATGDSYIIVNSIANVKDYIVNGTITNGEIQVYNENDGVLATDTGNGAVIPNNNNNQIRLVVKNGKSVNGTFKPMVRNGCIPNGEFQRYAKTNANLSTAGHQTTLQGWTSITANEFSECDIRAGLDVGLHKYTILLYIRKGSNRQTVKFELTETELSKLISKALASISNTLVITKNCQGITNTNVNTLVRQTVKKTEVEGVMQIKYEIIENGTSITSFDNFEWCMYAE